MNIFWSWMRWNSWWYLAWHWATKYRVKHWMHFLCTLWVMIYSWFHSKCQWWILKGERDGEDRFQHSNYATMHANKFFKLTMMIYHTLKRTTKINYVRNCYRRTRTELLLYWVIHNFRSHSNQLSIRFGWNMLCSKGLLYF